MIALRDLSSNARRGIAAATRFVQVTNPAQMRRRGRFGNRHVRNLLPIQFVSDA